MIGSAAMSMSSLCVVTNALRLRFFKSKFIKEEKTLATVKDIVKHIDHIKNLIGIDYIGLGSDFDGISNSNIELKDASMMNLLLDELHKSGYTKEEIEKISYKNVLRVFKENFLN